MVWADSTTEVKVCVRYGQSEARNMLKLLNDFRAGKEAWVWNQDNQTKTVYKNLKPLTYDYELEKTAMLRAAEIALYYNHTRPNGTLCFTAFEGSYYALAENIAAGYPSGESVFEGWKETNENYAGQGHRRAMLSPDYTAVGIGHVYYNGCHYWVQEFRSPTGTAPETKAVDGNQLTEIEILRIKRKMNNEKIEKSINGIDGSMHTGFRVFLFRICIFGTASLFRPLHNGRG